MDGTATPATRACTLCARWTRPASPAARPRHRQPPRRGCPRRPGRRPAPAVAATSTPVSVTAAGTSCSTASGAARWRPRSPACQITSPRRRSQPNLGCRLAACCRRAPEQHHLRPQRRRQPVLQLRGAAGKLHQRQGRLHQDGRQPGHVAQRRQPVRRGAPPVPRRRAGQVLLAGHRAAAAGRALCFRGRQQRAQPRQQQQAVRALGVDAAGLRAGGGVRLRAGLAGPGVRRVQERGPQHQRAGGHGQLQHRPALRGVQIRVDRLRLRHRLPLHLPDPGRQLPLQPAAQPAGAAAPAAQPALAAGAAVM